jgi:hypothetical protein
MPTVRGYADLHFLIPELINVVDFGKGPYYTGKGNLNTRGLCWIHYKKFDWKKCGKIGRRQLQHAKNFGDV